MRVIRVRYRDKTFYGSLFGDEVQCLNRSLGLTSPLPLSELAVLPPVAPTKIVCAAVNYKAHAEEVGMAVPDEPVIFFKPPSAIIGSGQRIILPPQSARVDFEGELAVIIGKTCRDVAPENAGEHIFGYCCANDVTARDLQTKDKLFGRAKGFDTFAPVGPWIETQVEDVRALSLVTSVNGQVRQRGHTADMIFGPAELIGYVSRIMTLNPGDVIMTGTPPGIGPIKPGDEVRVDISQVGILINPVAAAASGAVEEANGAPIQ